MKGDFMSNKENNEFNDPNMKEKCETHKMENENYNYADNRHINPNYADYENAIKGETVSVSKRGLKTAVAGVLIFAVAGGSGFAVGRAINHGPGMDGTRQATGKNIEKHHGMRNEDKNHNSKPPDNGRDNDENNNRKRRDNERDGPDEKIKDNEKASKPSNGPKKENNGINKGPKNNNV